MLLWCPGALSEIERLTLQWKNIARVAFFSTVQHRLNCCDNLKAQTCP